MERLTEKVNGGYRLKIPKDKNISDLEIKLNAYDKLGAYEGAEELGLLAGLTPKEEGDTVCELDRVIEYCLDKVSNTEAGKMYLKLAEWLTELKEYQFLIETEALLKPPCSIGDTVWCIFESEVYEGKAEGFNICVGNQKQYVNIEVTYGIVDPFYNDGRLMHRHDPKRFGKTVFLTKKEAKVALERMKGA